MPVLVSVRNATARYGRREVFRDLSFDLRVAQSLGVLGPNGAGKTTLLRMLIGCISPVTGEIRIGGFRPRDAVVRSGIAYFAGGTTLPPSVRAIGASPTYELGPCMGSPECPSITRTNEGWWIDVGGPSVLFNHDIED